MYQEGSNSWRPPQVPEQGDVLDNRRRPFKRRKWEVRSLQNSHHEVIRRLLLGQKHTEIAREMNLTTVQVSNIANSPLVQQRLNVLQAVRDKTAMDISMHIKSILPKAVILLEQIIDGRVEGEDGKVEHPGLNLRSSVARDLLDRGGYPKTIRSENLNATLSREDIDDIKRRAEERRRLVPVADRNCCND